MRCDSCGDTGLIEVGRDVYTRCTACPSRRNDPAEGARLRDEAVAQVGQHTRASWISSARAVVRDLCREGEPFTTDDVWARIGSPPEPRAMGAVMTWARGRGYCHPTETFRPTSRPEGHRSPKRVWQPAARW